jgi:hypothetical protein
VMVTEGIWDGEREGERIARACWVNALVHCVVVIVHPADFQLSLTIQANCHTVLLSYSPTIIQSYCHTVLLSYILTVMQSY